MTDKEKLMESLMKAYDDEFFKINGFHMNRQQRRALEKRLEILAKNELDKMN